MASSSWQEWSTHLPYVEQIRNPGDGVTWESAELMLAREREALWKSEYEIRVRTAGPTFMESTRLTSSDYLTDNVKLHADASKVCKHYGKPNGGNAACKRLLKYLCEKDNWQPGNQCGKGTVAFTLCKHLLLADRKQGQGQSGVACRCFAATYLMLGGCTHLKGPLHKAPLLSETLCPTCSTCIRCNKLLSLLLM